MERARRFRMTPRFRRALDAILTRGVPDTARQQIEVAPLTVPVAEPQPEAVVAVPRPPRITSVDSWVVPPNFPFNTASGVVQAYPYGQTAVDEQALAAMGMPRMATQSQPSPPPTQSSSPVAALLPSRWEIEGSRGKRRVVLEDEPSG